MKRNWIILIAAAALVVLVLLANRAGKDNGSPAATRMMEAPSGDRTGMQPGDSAPKKGSAAPAFTLTTLDGKSAYQVGGPRDKALVVNFWASWCGPCDMEAPDLVALYGKYKDKMDLYAVNATNNDKLRNAKVFVKEKEFEFPALTDAKGEAGNAYQVFAYPTSFIVDRSGKIVERIDGVITLAQWEKYLDQVTKS